jgi:hypothetical protein
MESQLYKFISVNPQGQAREHPHVKDAFDNKGRNDEVYVVVIETGSRYKVLKP